ncbi:hypothetical protein MBLNU230_g5971t1 [Neophaeotheca triangularis]
MPKRSPGCFNCRRRKVRCDETRPWCNRCATHGVQCLGYRTEKAGGFEFQDQTKEVVIRAKQVYRRKATEHRSSTDSTSSEFDSERSVSSTSSTPGLPSQSNSNHFATTSSQPTLSKNLALIQTPPPTQSIHSPAATRSALYQTFLDLYIPRSSPVTGDHFSFFNKLFSITTPPHAALTAGLDALSLCQIGSIHKDTNLLRSASASYGAALNALHRSLAGMKSEQAVRDDNVLAAVTVLTVCEFYDSMGDPQGQGWGRHVHGMENLLEARGPSTLESDLSLQLFSHARQGSLCHALIERRELKFARPEWRAAAFRCPIVDRSTWFCDVAVRLPGLLERHDRLADDIEVYEAGKADESWREDGVKYLLLSNVDQLVTDCEMLELELRQWYYDWLAMTNGEPKYTLEPIETFTTFTGLVTNRTFDHAYNFPNFMVGYLYSLYWLCIYNMRVNLRSLCALREKLESYSWTTFCKPRGPDWPSEEELVGYVFDLCQCMPFFCEPISSATGNVGLFLPLRTAAFWFRDHAMWRHLVWIGEVREKCFVKGLSPPRVDSGKLPNLPQRAGQAN